MDLKTGAAAVVGAALGAAAAWYVLSSTSHRPRVQVTAAAGGGEALTAGGVSMSEVLTDDILREQFTRNTQFFGNEAQQALAGSFVVVVGLGGVGSHAAHMLLRAGVGRLRLVDFDQVSLSSLNRHAVAVRADVGTPKATCLAAHFREIVPEAQVEACVAMYTPEREEELLGGRPDYVVDAIDNIDTKVALLAACYRRGARVVCCAGAGGKADPTRLRIADLAEATVDPLARAVRHRLRAQHGIESGIPVLLSTEKARCGLVAPDEVDSGAASLADYQVVPNFRIRTIPVLGTSPAAFGMAAAAHVLCALAGAPLLPESVFLVKEGQSAALYAGLVERLQSGGGDVDTLLLVDEPEVAWLARDVWRGFSARAAASGQLPRDKGLRRDLAQLSLVRWDNSRPADVDNLLLLTHDEADAHEGADLATLRASEPEFAAYVEARLALAAASLGRVGDGRIAGLWP